MHWIYSTRQNRIVIATLKQSAGNGPQEEIAHCVINELHWFLWMLGQVQQDEQQLQSSECWGQNDLPSTIPKPSLIFQWDHPST